MKYVIAYGLVILLAGFCFTLGAFITTIPAAGSLAWASGQLRGVLAGILSGLGGVAAAVAFGYFVFRLVLGSSAFGLFPLLATTIPLIFPIRKELAKARLFFNDVTELRDLMRKQAATGEGSLDSLAEDQAGMALGLKFRAVGAVLGFVFAFLWLMLVHK